MRARRGGYDAMSRAGGGRTTLWSFRQGATWNNTYLSMLLTEIEMTEKKIMVHILSSSHSSIAALKDVLAYGRLMSSPHLPPPSPSGALPTTPIPYPYTYRGSLWVKPEGVGGGRKGAKLINLPFPRQFWCTLHTKADCTVSSSLERLFNSIIYNSVMPLYSFIPRALF